MNDSQTTWNQRFQNATEVPAPVAVLTDNAHLIQPGQRVLELACGLGGNALWLAQQGCDVTAWDISDIGLAKLESFAQAEGLTIHCQQQDLTQPPAIVDTLFDIIVVSRYLDRPLCQIIPEWLNDGGLLFYQTFTRQKVRPGGPGNPDFLLAPGELFQLFPSLIPVIYREESDIGDLEQGLRNQAYFVGRKAS